MKKSVSIAVIAAAAFGLAAPASAFEPNRPVEFVVTAGPGGGTDIFARTIQAIIGKYELMKAPVVVTNKGSAGGAEGLSTRLATRAIPTSSPSAPTMPTCCRSAPRCPIRPRT